MTEVTEETREEMYKRFLGLIEASRTQAASMESMEGALSRGTMEGGDFSDDEEPPLPTEEENRKFTEKIRRVFTPFDPE